jgi:urocanate hydratase
MEDMFRRGGLNMAVAITRDDLSASDLSTPTEDSSKVPE